MKRMSPWMVAGVLLAMLLGTIHGYIGVITDARYVRRLNKQLGPRL